MSQVRLSVKSKKRVTDHGEVFTSEREVQAMLDLVKQETERIESRFLEPACGTGNFLDPILKRKLDIIKKRYKKSQLEFERYGVVAVGSIYGVDILHDNVVECRNRLFSIFDSYYTELYKKKCTEDYRHTIRFVLERNILLGDALTLKTIGKKNEPIVFSEWTLVRGSYIKRRDYAFAELIPDHQSTENTLFSATQLSDTGSPVFIPEPKNEFPLSHFLKLPYEITH